MASISPAPPPRPAGEIAPGTKLGDYIVEEKVGQGGMGSVYRAVHPMIGKHAAIKVINGDLNEQYNIERFLDEARVVNTIGHPNIVDVFAFGETPDGRSFLIMEWLKGETLSARIERAPIDLAEIAEIIRPLTRALMAAHEKGVIHRDLKPDNIFLVENRGESAIVKLLDFGIAKPASTTHRVAKTATGAIVGTPLYIAPEQAKGREIDSAADVYALGGIMFELLCRRPPFMADNAMEIVAKHLMEPPPRPSAFVRVPPALDDLVLNMLAKEPMERPLLPAVLKVLDTLRADRRVATPNPEDGKTQVMLEPREGRLQTPVPMRMSAMSTTPPPPMSAQPIVPAAAAVSMPGSRPLFQPARLPTDLPPGAPTTQTHAPRSRLPWILAGAVGLAVVIVIGIAASGGSIEQKEGDHPAPAIVPIPDLKISPGPAGPTAEPIEGSGHAVEPPKPSPTATPKPELATPGSFGHPVTGTETKPPPTRTKPPVARKLPTPKPKPPNTGSGTIPKGDELAAPGQFDKPKKP